MPSLTIAWEYLTGYAVATGSSSYDEVEWPPHPARVFMALAAAWFETEPSPEEKTDRADWESEGRALAWLESLGDPEMRLPCIDRLTARSNVTHYVPVNDRAGPASATLQSCPSITRSKQPRSYPRLWVGHGPIQFHWPEVQDAEKHNPALDRLCRKVTRIGHSSSLVAMRVIKEDVLSQEGLHLVPDPLESVTRARSLTPGTLEMLRELYGEETRHRHATLIEEIQRLRSERKLITGKGSSDRKAANDAHSRSLQEELSTLTPRPPVRPSVGHWTGYGEGRTRSGIIPGSLFDPDLLVLTLVDGLRLPLTSTLLVTRALRETLMSMAPNPLPAWLSGHTVDGAPLRDDDGHIAIVPLPFVGHKHADGHLLGVALALPRSVPLAERGRVLGPVLINDREPRDIDLKLGRLGVWTVHKREWQDQRLHTRQSAWTAAPNGSRLWASVTPVVLDRFPKAKRIDPSQRSQWEAEVELIIRTACVRVGLPEPELIDIDRTSWHPGCPRAVDKRRTLRGHANLPNRPEAALGDGFPPFPEKGANAPRPQVHVWLRFAQPVVGPVLLGAGRFLGYGLCKPLRGRDR